MSIISDRYSREPQVSYSTKPQKQYIAERILPGHKALDAVKHCQDLMTPKELDNDKLMRHIAPIRWTDEMIQQARDTDKRINNFDHGGEHE